MNKPEKDQIKNEHQIILTNDKTPLPSCLQITSRDLNTSNDNYIDLLTSKINNPYQKKINFINLVLNSSVLKLSSNPNQILGELKYFFRWISPLNNEFLMGSFTWNHKLIETETSDKKIIFQNSISKQDINDYFYKNYINLIEQVLKNSNIPYLYLEFKSKRFNKIIDVLFVCDLE